MNKQSKNNQAVVTGVGGNIVSILAPEGAIIKNEVANICVGDEKLKSEVLRVHGRTADIQVFEETAGVKVGDPVELTRQLLSVSLGPGLLGSIYDGLQIPLYEMAEQHGFFLKRGVEMDPFDMSRRWPFQPVCQVGDILAAGDVLGTVVERQTNHKIMVPFDEPGDVEVLRIAAGEFAADDEVALIRDSAGRERSLQLTQRWPVRQAMTANMLKRRLIERT